MHKSLIAVLSGGTLVENLSQTEDEEVTINHDEKTTMKEISSTYLTSLIKFMDGYFISRENPSRVNTAVPEWIPLTKLCFDFSKDIDIVRQMQGFRDLTLKNSLKMRLKSPAFNTPT